MPDNQKPSGYLTALFLGSTAFVFLNFSLPVRADDLGFSATAIGGMYAVFTGTILLIRPLVGFFLDRYGRRWFFTAAFVFYTAAMTVFAQGDTLVDFYMARLLQGLGASLMWVSARTMVADLNDTGSRGEAMGRLTTTSVRGSMLGAVYGFTLLGFLPMQQAWIGAFAGYALLTAAALVWSLFRVSESRVILDKPVSPHRQQRVVWSMELRKVFVIVVLSAFASALIEPIYLIYLKNKHQVGVQLLAFAFLPAGIVFAIVPAYAGRWSDRIGRAKILALGILFAGCVSVALPFWSSLVLVAASYILFAFGWAMADPVIDALVADLSPADYRGRIMGALEAFAGIGAALGPVIGGYIYDTWAAEAAFVLNGVTLIFTAALAYVWFRNSKIAGLSQQ